MNWNDHPVWVVFCDDDYGSARECKRRKIDREGLIVNIWSAAFAAWPSPSIKRKFETAEPVNTVEDDSRGEVWDGAFGVQSKGMSGFFITCGQLVGGFEAKETHCEVL